LPNALSGGQQQRAAIARALANDPPLVVADEPTGNLDTGTAAEMLALFEKLTVQGKTLLIVTHDQGLSARTERVLHLVDGSLYRDQNNGHHTPAQSTVTHETLEAAISAIENEDGR
jgi:putative ABC transport system ATP-binding protein